jgi:hypothetical protein
MEHEHRSPSRSHGRRRHPDHEDASPAPGRNPARAPTAAGGGGTPGLASATAAAVVAETMIPQLAAALGANDYGESGRLSFELRMTLRRGQRAADGLGDEAAAVRERLEVAAQIAAPLLADAPTIEDTGAGGEAAETAWHARRGSAPPAAPATAQIAQPSPAQLAQNVIAAGARGASAGDRWSTMQIHARSDENVMVVEQVQGLIASAARLLALAQHQQVANEAADVASNDLAHQLQVAGTMLLTARGLLGDGRRDLRATIDKLSARVEQLEADVRSTPWQRGSSATAAALGHEQPLAAPAYTRGARDSGPMSGMQAEALIRNTPLVYTRIRLGDARAQVGTGRVIIHEDFDTYRQAHREMIYEGDESERAVAEKADHNARNSGGAADARGFANVYVPQASWTTTLHELMHVYSSNELLQGAPALAEGAADYFAREVCRANALAYPPGYPVQLAAIDHLVDRVGQEDFAAFVFGGSNAVKEKLELLGEGTWRKYVRLFGDGDYISASMLLWGLRDAVAANEEAERARATTELEEDRAAAKAAEAARITATDAPRETWPPEGDMVAVNTINVTFSGGRWTARLLRGGRHGVREGWSAVATLEDGTELAGVVSFVTEKYCDVELAPSSKGAEPKHVVARRPQ